MDSRRSIRVVPPVDDNRRSTRNSPSRQSPSRVRGESRTISPRQLRAPSTQSNVTDEGSVRSRGRPRKNPLPAAIPEDGIGEANSSSGESPSRPKVNMSPKISLPTLSEENIRQLTGASAVTTRSSVTTTKSRVQVTGDGENLGEVAARYKQRASAVLEEIVRRMTPTPSEASRRSGRSVSRDLVGANEFSDQEDGPEEEEEDDRASTRPPSRVSHREASRFRDVPYQRSVPVQLPVTAQPEFGGAGRVLFLMLFAALGGFYLQTACTKRACELYLPDSWPTWETLHMHFHRYIAYLYLGLASWVFTLYWIPAGYRVRCRHEGEQVQFTFNGVFVSLTVLACIYVVTFHYDFPVMNLMYNHYTHFLSVAIAFAFLLSVWGYRRSLIFEPHTWNPFASSGNVIVDYYAGRQINAFWSEHVDVKLTHYRFNVIIALLINTMFFVRNFEFAPLDAESWATMAWPELFAFHYMHNKYDVATLVVTSLMMIYVIDLLVWERHLVSSIELMQEGMGVHALLRYALYPVELSMMSKYVFEHHVPDVPSWAYGVMVVVFLIGLVIKRRSNRVKFEFKMFRNEERFKDMEYLRTPQGRYLILSGWWGLVRHPNYVGDIITTLSICIPLIWRFAWPPLLVAIWTVVIIVHRAERANAHNLRRYGSQWIQYCQKVPFKFIPGIY